VGALIIVLVGATGHAHVVIYLKKAKHMNTTVYFSGGFALIILLLSGCASDSEVAPITYQQQTSSPVVNYALTLQGAPYHYGSDNPEDGFDCSGFVHHVYQQQGINLPRTTEDMATMLTSVEKDELHLGDLVFFDTNGKTFSHVGLYVDNNNFIHAPSARTGRVLVSSLKNNYWQQHFVGARRP
jgi:cell wall-associated NlpC family hydrolase